MWLIVRSWSLRLLQTRVAQVGVHAIAAALVLAGAWVGLELSAADARADDQDGGIAWVYYTPQRLAKARQAGAAVVLDFTADWCLNCKFLEKTVLNTDAVSAALRQRGVVPMKVDITSSRNVAGTALLRDMGRFTIPLLVVQDPAGQTVMIEDFYTAGQVLDAVETATR